MKREKGQPEHRPKALAVSLSQDVFHALAWHARDYEMSPRAFLSHLAECYVAAMERAEQASKGSNQGR